MLLVCLFLLTLMTTWSLSLELYLLVAVMVVEPVFLAVTTPLLFTVATVFLLLFHL